MRSLLFILLIAGVLIACDSERIAPIQNPSLLSSKPVEQTLEISVNLDAETEYYSKSAVEAGVFSIEYDFSFAANIDFVKNDINHFAQINFQHIYDERNKQFYWNALMQVDGVNYSPVKSVADETEALSKNNQDYVNSTIMHRDPANDSRIFRLYFDEEGELSGMGSIKSLYEGSILELESESPDKNMYPNLSIDFSGSTQYAYDFLFFREFSVKDYLAKYGETANVTADIRLDHTLAPFDSHSLFNPQDPSTFHHVTATTVYGAQGKSHVLQLYFRKMESMGHELWHMYVYLSNELIMPMETQEYLELVYDGILRSPLVNLDGEELESALISYGVRESSFSIAEKKISFDVTNVLIHEDEFHLLRLSQDGYSAHRASVNLFPSSN